MKRFIGTKADIAFTPHNDKFTERDLKNLESIHKLFKHDVMNVGVPMPAKRAQKPLHSLTLASNSGMPMPFEKFMTDEEWWASEEYRVRVKASTTFNERKK